MEYKVLDLPYRKVSDSIVHYVDEEQLLEYTNKGYEIHSFIGGSLVLQRDNFISVNLIKQVPENE